MLDKIKLISIPLSFLLFVGGMFVVIYYNPIGYLFLFVGLYLTIYAGKTVGELFIKLTNNHVKVGENIESKILNLLYIVWYDIRMLLCKYDRLIKKSKY